VTLCECGCGEDVSYNRRWKYQAKYKQGHNNRGKRYGNEVYDSRRGASNARWCGDRRITYDGYWEIRMPDHSRAKNNRGFVKEHIVIMEKILGRPLEEGEVVHHKDGNRLNNAEENLELTTWEVHTHDHHKGKKLTSEHRANIAKSHNPKSDLNLRWNRTMREV
jgi:hypothetical protein